MTLQLARLVMNKTGTKLEQNRDKTWTAAYWLAKRQPGLGCILALRSRLNGSRSGGARATRIIV
jgi:hypothetical protein